MNKWIGAIAISICLCVLSHINADLGKLKDYQKENKVETFKSKTIPFSLQYNTTNWMLSKKHLNEYSEVEFKLKNYGDIHASMINEDLAWSYEYMKDLVYENINDYETVKSFELINEWKTEINGIMLNCLKFKVEIDKSAMTIIYYIHCGEDCTFQLVFVYPYKHEEKYNSLVSELCNGLKIQK